MAFSDELRSFERSAEQIKREKKEEAKKVIGQLLTDHIDTWAAYVFEAIRNDIKKKAEYGFFQIIGKDKKEIVGVTELSSDINGFYNTRAGMRCNVHPCYKIPISDEEKAIIEAGFEKNARNKGSNAYIPCLGVGLKLVDNCLWCQKIYFTKGEKLLFLIKVSGKPKSEYVETLLSKVQALGMAEGIKIKFLTESGSIVANYSIKY